ncbi:hypothetical protein [Kaarinaea lacus]
MKGIQDKQGVTLFIVSLLTLFFSFNFNLFHAVNPEKFDSYQSDSEALVIGRLVKSGNDGIFSSEARLGRYMGLEGDMNLNQTKLFVGEINGGEYEEYDSQFGMQGIFLGQLEYLFKKLNFKPSTRLAIYRGVTSLLFALVLSIVIVVLYFDIGIEASCFLLATIVLSKWQVYMGKNLYWMVYAMFLPMVIVLLAVKLEELGRKVNIFWVALLVMLAVFLKSTMGYEFISTILLAMLAPLVYFAVKNSWSGRKLLLRCSVIGAFGLLGFVFAIILHTYQLTLATGSTEQAVSIIEDRILTRTHADPELFLNTPYYESQKASVFSVVFDEYLLRGGSFRLKVPYLLWILVFVFITFKVFKEKYELTEFRISNPVLRALIITTWLSILAPLSWFVLAKSHSYIHTDINIILWHLPFMIFGFALIGYILRTRIQRLLARIATALK